MKKKTCFSTYLWHRCARRAVLVAGAEHHDPVRLALLLVRALVALALLLVRTLVAMALLLVRTLVAMALLLVRTLALALALALALPWSLMRLKRPARRHGPERRVLRRRRAHDVQRLAARRVGADAAAATVPGRHAERHQPLDLGHVAGLARLGQRPRRVRGVEGRVQHRVAAEGQRAVAVAVDNRGVHSGAWGLCK
jgi:hypothetical protein